MIIAKALLLVMLGFVLGVLMCLAPVIWLFWADGTKKELSKEEWKAGYRQR